MFGTQSRMHDSNDIRRLQNTNGWRSAGNEECPVFADQVALECRVLSDVVSENGREVTVRGNARALVTMECQNSAGAVSWIKDGQSGTSTVSCLKQANAHCTLQYKKLSIRDVVPEDEGEYFCQNNNKSSSRCIVRVTSMTSFLQQHNARILTIALCYRRFQSRCPFYSTASEPDCQGWDQRYCAISSH